MCGIAGAFSQRIEPALESLVRQIVERQKSRGPDHMAVERHSGERAEAVLGHNRLSIIDLSADANQPMTDPASGRAIVFNGEIYNYLEVREDLAALGCAFRTRSDTEVLLAAIGQWGADALERLNGMFAFAIFDPLASSLFLARDRFGVKPLYYAIEEESLLFASLPGEIAKRVGARPNLEYAARGLRYGVYDEGSLSPYCGVSALRPGCWAEVSVDADGRLALREREYYCLSNRVQEQIEEVATLPLNAAIELVGETLESAVDLRFRSDVPVAIALSGGLDSSSVAASSVSRGRDVVSGFTFGAPDDPSTEGPVVSRLASRLGMRAEYVWPSVSRRIEGFFDTLYAQDAPFAEASQVGQFLVYERVHEAGFKVLLGGQGGDEMFMGYRKYLAFRLNQLRARRDIAGLVRFGASLLPSMLGEARRLSLYWRERDRYRRAAGRDTAVRMPHCEPIDMGHIPSRPLWERQVKDVYQTSLPTLLRYEDRNSMAHSVESRLPFMDYRVAELGLALPTALKLRAGHGKWAVRQAMAGRLPNEIRLARLKRHFDVGIDAWIQEGFGDRLRAELGASWTACRQFVGSGERPEILFSDQAIRSRPTALTEATSLLWLAKRS